MLALLDGDVLIHSTFYYSRNLEEFKKNFERNLESWVLGAFCDQYKVAIKGGSNFRTKFYPDYKKSPAREKQRETLKGTYLSEAYEWTSEQNEVWPACRGWEADDQLVCWAHRIKNPETVIISVDKDLFQVPGWNYNPKKNHLRFIEEEEARRFFCQQMLQGDTIDNIPGCPGIGPIKARRILDTSKNPGQETIDTYRSIFGNRWKKHFMFNGTLLYLRRHSTDVFNLDLFIERFVSE